MSIHSVLSAASRRWRFALGAPIAAAMLAAIPAAMVPAPAAAQTYTSIIEPGSPEIAQTICARLRTLDLPNARVLPIAGGRLAVETNTADHPNINGATLAAVLTQPGMFGLHAASDRPVEGLEERRPAHADAASVFVAPDAFVTNADLAGVQAVANQTDRAVVVVLSDQGSQRLQGSSATLVGRHLAVVVDDVVWDLQAVDAPIADGRLRFSASGTDLGPVGLVAVLAGGPLPDGLHIVGSQLGSEDPGAVPTCTSN